MSLSPHILDLVEIDVEKVESELAQAEEDAEEDITCPKTLEAAQDGGGLTSASTNANASSSTSTGQKSVDKFSPEPRQSVIHLCFAFFVMWVKSLPRGTRVCPVK